MNDDKEQEIKGEITDGLRLSDAIIFRDSKSLGSEMVQIIILVITFALACFIAYIVLVMLIIFIYHLAYDHDPQKIPKFVKNSPQFNTRIRAIKRRIIEKQQKIDYLRRKEREGRFDPETGELKPKHKTRVGKPKEK